MTDPVSGKNKSLGSLSPDQLSRLLALQDGVHSMARMNAQIANSPRVKALLAREGVFFQWSWLYEMSYAEMLAYGLSAIGEAQMISSAFGAEDPQEEVISNAEAYDPEPHRPKASQLLQGVAFMMAGFHSMRAIELYSKPLSRLIAEGRAGNDESFLKSVRVDPSCLSSPSLAKRVSLASMRGERKFLKRIHKAALEGPNKGLLVYRKLRTATTLLDEAGAFQRASRKRIYAVLVEELNLYEGIKGDPLKSLFRNMSLWRKDAAT